jgi:antagonist of KipI
MSGIRVLKPGLLTTPQDSGRSGLRSLGVGTGGAADAYALRIANRLAGCEPGEAALEITLVGPTLRFEADALVALCGANLSPEMEGWPFPRWRPVFVRRGSVLRFGAPIWGCRAYLAARGGFDLPAVMESRSHSAMMDLGGILGRPLREGDILSFREPDHELPGWLERRRAPSRSEAFAAPGWSVSLWAGPRYSSRPTLRVLPGEQFEAFPEASRATFLSSERRVTPESNRIGCRLDGPKIEWDSSEEMISEPVAVGTIQVPPSGMPVALLADGPTTGGYPKIAHVISADLPLLAQAKPGDILSFQAVNIQEAQNLHVQREWEIRLIQEGIALHSR